MQRLFLRPLLLLTGAAAFLFVAGCDSDDTGDTAASTTVQFETGDLSVLEVDSPTLELPVSISNPPGSEVTVEVLFAATASQGATLADLGIADINNDRAFYGEDDSLNAYVTETVTFGPDAEDGATQTVQFDIADDETEGEETAVFALQNATSTGGRAVSVGDPKSLTATIEAEGTVTFVSEDFSDDALSPFTQYSVASGNNWVVSDFDGNFYAEANGYGAGEPSNDWLISPALDFASTADETLSFRNAKNFDDAGLDRGLQVLISTDYDGEGNPENFNWTNISDRVAAFSEGDYEFVSSGEIDLSDEAFQSSNTYIAFQYRSSGTGGGTTEAWQVDDVVITGLGAAPEE